MNGRIKELSRQAWEWAEQQEYKDATQEFSDILEQKFAELIIQECLGCSNNLANHYINNHSEKEQTLLLAAIADYSSEIRKHFGVSE
jgi:hypothetical protein